MTLGEKMKFLRTQRGLTLEEVGRKVGVGKSTVRKWESGAIANMRRDKIALVAKALGTTPEYLMGWAFTERLSTLIPQRGLTFEDVADAIGLSAEDIDRMCAGDLEPTYEEFQALARLLNVTEDCLSGKTAFDIVEPGAQHDSTDPREQELVSIYRDLNDQGQSVLMGTARGLSANPEMQRPEASTAK